MDRYTRIVLGVIAAALIYLCVVLTPLPALRAQGTQRPGEGMGPVQVVIVGWRAPTGEVMRVALDRPVQVAGTVQVAGQVTTTPVERASRVVIAGYEMATTRDNSSGFRPFSIKEGLPTTTR
jgi:hypothetical protein